MHACVRVCVCACVHVCVSVFYVCARLHAWKSVKETCTEVHTRIRNFTHNCSAAPVDYSATPAPNPVQFLAGDGPLTQRNTTFTIIDDSIVEPQEFFSATGSVTAPFVTFSNGLNADAVNVNIVDNDGK